MESFRQRGGILMELQNLISQSFAPGNSIKGFENLHKQILKRHYNAKNVSIDYHRQRVKMDLILEGKEYDTVITAGQLSTIPANFYFEDIGDFLISCLSDDVHNMNFYKELINSVAATETEEFAV